MCYSINWLNLQIKLTTHLKQYKCKEIRKKTSFTILLPRRIDDIGALLGHILSKSSLKHLTDTLIYCLFGPTIQMIWHCSNWPFWLLLQAIIEMFLNSAKLSEWFGQTSYILIRSCSEMRIMLLRNCLKYWSQILHEKIESQSEPRLTYRTKKAVNAGYCISASHSWLKSHSLYSSWKKNETFQFTTSI